MNSTLHDLVAAFATIGGTPEGGVCRLTGTDEDRAARDLLSAEMRRRGLSVRVDAIGNMFGVAALAPHTRDAVLVGSHLDSQPTGGRFDGAYGVLAGMLAVEQVSRRAAAEPGKARRNAVLVNWTNEEGARFQPSLTGSCVFTGATTLDAALGLADGDGVSLGDELQRIGYRGTEALDLVPAHYLELHVEQGASLEDAGCDIGVVTGAWATRKLTIVFEGEPSHTGPMPMARRQDALRAAARGIEALYEEAGRTPGSHASAARMSVWPNSPNVVAGRVRVWFEMRNVDEAAAYAIGDRFLDRIRERSAELGVGVSIAADEKRGPAMFDAGGVKVVTEAAGACGFSCMDAWTIAGHDALAIQRRFPASLIFVPSRDGLSHNPKEFTSPEALDKGLAVLTEALWRLLTE